jgi:hypothetical protein
MRLASLERVAVELETTSQGGLLEVDHDWMTLSRRVLFDASQNRPAPA